MLADTLEFIVTGVVRVPKRSHIQFDVLLSFETLRAMSPEMYEGEMAGGWLDLNVINYALLREGTDVEAFADKIKDLPNERAGDFLAQWGGQYQLTVAPLTGIYLNAEIGNSIGPQSDISYVYLLSTVGLFLLLIAAINFTNLATARSADRAKEVGLRKAIGSSRRVLVGQFLLSTFMTCLMAIICAFVIAWMALPYFNNLAGTVYETTDLLTLPMAAFGVVVLMALTVLAGIHPAFLLSGYKPVEVLKGRFVGKAGGSLLRKGLVVLQFSISGLLILGTLVVWSQLRFMQNQDLGFDAEQVLVLDARQAPGDQRVRLTDVILDRLASHASVEEVSSIYTVPGRNAWRGQLSFPETYEEGESISLEYFPVGWDFEKTLGLDLVAGRSFDREIQLDATQAVVINEAAVREAGWASPEEAVGKGFSSPGSRKPNGQVIGVVRDYHQHGLQGEIEPVMFGIRVGNGMFAIRYSASATASVMNHARETWDAFFAEYPYDVFFLDDDFAQQYAAENRLLRIFGTFAILTIFIACLGLVGLAAFTAARRTKEIGIRKAIGATVPQLVGLLSLEFVRLVAVSFLIAGTAGYFLLEKWLSEFAFRISIGAELFAVTGVILLAIAFLSVCYQAVRAATSDPVDSLRYE
jgi:putative ABC transport system permease protein